MKNKLETIITEAINKDIETFYKDIDAMQKLRERFEKMLIFISRDGSSESSDELIDETERMIFELDKKIKDYYNESDSDNFELN